MTTVRTNSPKSVGGRIFMTLFFSVFLAMGLGFSGMVARSFWALARTHTWTAVDCTVVECQVVQLEGKSGVELNLLYRYRYNNRDYTSSRLSRGITSSRNAAETYKLSQQLTPGSRTTCYVNPISPEDAVLFRGSLWTGLIVLFPLIFVAVGLGGIFFAWRRQPAASSISQKSISSGKQKDFGPVAISVLCSLFLLVGVTTGYGFFVRPMLNIAAARAWTSVPCTIVSSRVVDHSDSDGTTYSVEVVYRYVLNGQSYTSARYKFMSGSSSGYRAKADIVAQLPTGKKVLCYVNPNDPADAVLDRGFTADIWFGLIPLVFALAGGCGLWFGVLRRKKPASAFAMSSVAVSSSSGVPSTPISGELRPEMTRVGKLIGFAIFALFWNGIVSIFVVIIASQWRHGEKPWGLSLFMTPFVAIGLFVIGGAVRQALALKNPRPRLIVNPAAVAIGQNVEVAWEMEGKVEVLRNLHITLQGREEATYRRGTDTVTDKNVFATFDLVNTTDPSAIRAGVARLTIPAHTMHSWQSRNNKVVWSLRVTGEIPRWPDIDDEFVFTVLPLPLA